MRIRLGDLRRLIREAVTGTVWRGMTNVSVRDLSKLIGGTPEQEGHARVDKAVPLSQMGWWAERRGLAMAYASTDPISGRRTGYDVLMKGEVVRPDSGPGEVTHQLRKDMTTSVKITDVYYAVPGRDRKGTLERLLGQI